ncbi:SERTA domain-containing protein 3 [Paramarasmius palmivorus]|uniref:SERTA domain-containing protein 3 n=1 Tax=Paramarasmius palmivorus TaxID=297713 RepID=A0AAW0BJ82_9AGAR
MPNPGVFHGAPLRFLEARLPGYFTAACEGYGTEFLAEVQREYFKIWKPNAVVDEQLTDEEIEQILANDAEDEDDLLVKPVQEDDETLEAFDARMEEFSEAKKRVAVKCGQMDRWFQYRFRKAQESNMKDSETFRRLMAKLTGTDTGPGRRRPAYVIWARDNAELIEGLLRDYWMKKLNLKDEASIRLEVIEKEFAKLSEDQQKSCADEALAEFSKSCSQGVLGAPRSAILFWASDNYAAVDSLVAGEVAETQKAVKFLKKGSSAYVAVRQEVVKRAFDSLSTEEKKQWSDTAKSEHEARVEKWNKEKNLPFPQDPESLQKCINGISNFLTPILEGVHEATGWCFSLFSGGPEPVDKGRLNTVALHIGKSAGPVQMTFGAAFHPQIKQSFNPLFGKFLKRTYSVVECRRRALDSSSQNRLADGVEDTTFAVVYDSVDDRATGDGSESQKSTPV